MKKLVISLLTLFFGVVLWSHSLWAGDVLSQTKTNGVVSQIKSEVVMVQSAPDLLVQAQELMDLAQAQELMEKDGFENFKKVLYLTTEAIKKDPGSFQANWMAAKACWFYGMYAQELYLSDWKDICRLYGKKGMAYAEKAIALNPESVEGHFWYGMNVGIYSDSVSMISVLFEGLKSKVQNSFETAYQYDKYYDHGGPIAALGRFWAVLPWPLNDNKLAMKYYQEFHKTKFFGRPYTVQFHVYYAELLMKDSATKNEAKALLEQVPKLSKNKYWNDQAKALLEEM
jgi:virulence-associated protein VapD